MSLEGFLSIPLGERVGVRGTNDSGCYPQEEKMPVQKHKEDVVGTQSSRQSIVAGGSYTSSSFNLDAIKALVAGMQVVFGGTPDGNAKLEILTSPDNINWDTVAYTQFEVDYTASQTLMKSIPVNVDAAYAKIKITNLDSADNISVWGFIILTQDI